MSAASPRPALAVLGSESPERARALAAELGLPVADGFGPDVEFLLAPTATGLELRWSEAERSAPLRCDFGAAAYRARTTDPRAPLFRAVGIDRGVQTVLDATAGLGRDAFALAARGANVTMIERDPVLTALLADALTRTDRATSRLTLVPGTAEDELARLTGCDAADRPDAIYLDPMFPDRRKTALAKLDLQMLGRLLDPAPPDPALVLLARRVATRRVVVKRHPSAPPLLPGPIATVRGNRARFDLYTPA